MIEHREPLIYMLCAAAELEHALMCEYLFAAFTLKRSVEEGLTDRAARGGRALAIGDIGCGQAGDAASRDQRQPDLCARGEPPPVSTQPASTGAALPAGRAAGACCRSASKRSGTSCSSNVPKVWTSRTRRGSPRWTKPYRRWARRRSPRTFRSSLPSATCTARSRQGSVAYREVGRGQALHRSSRGSGARRDVRLAGAGADHQLQRACRRSSRSSNRVRVLAATGAARTSVTSSDAQRVPRDEGR